MTDVDRILIDVAATVATTRKGTLDTGTFLDKYYALVREYEESVDGTVSKEKKVYMLQKQKMIIEEIESCLGYTMNDKALEKVRNLLNELKGNHDVEISDMDATLETLVNHGYLTSIKWNHNSSGAITGTAEFVLSGDDL